MSFQRITRRSFSSRAVALPLAIPLALAAHRTMAQTPESSPVRVVATFSILGDWVGNVVGDLAEVTTIVPAGSDTHTFDPNPDQVKAIAEADLIFEIGLGFETWLDAMVESSGTAANRVVVSTGIDVLHFGDNEDDHAEHEDQEDAHDHGSDDPHIWGDVANAVNAVGIIATALAEADPANASTWQHNADAYIAELTTLDESIRAETGALGEDQRKLVTTHDTFAYYAHAYNFEIVGTALNSVTTESGDPSARDIAELVESIRDAKVTAIFAENVSNNALIETIAAEAGVELAPPLFTDALGDADSDASTYLAMMTWNTTTIVTALD